MRKSSFNIMVVLRSDINADFGFFVSSKIIAGPLHPMEHMEHVEHIENVEHGENPIIFISN